MYRGSSTRAGGKEPGPEGLISFGMNPVGTGPNSPKMVAALSKLKWLVMVENFENETATFWKAPKEYGGAAPKDIQTTVYQLPAANFAEKDGTFTNSSRWMQWKWKAIDPRARRNRTRRSSRASSSRSATSTGRKEGRSPRRCSPSTGATPIR